MNSENIPGQIISTANQAFDFFDKIYAKVVSIKMKKLSIKNYLRAYYLEVINNIELLHAVNFVKLKDEKVNSKICKSIINKLDTQIGATILFEEEIHEGTEIYKFLKSQGKIKNAKKMLVRNAEGKEESVKTKSFYENILQAISFTVVKIEVLKRLSEFDDEEIKLLHKILLEKRLVNIKERFNMIKKKLDELKEIRDLSR